MNTYRSIKAWGLALAALVLSACGNGNVAVVSGAGAGAGAGADVAWASPAVFAGSTSKSYALSECVRSLIDTNTFNTISEAPLYNARAVFDPNGDVSIQAALTTTGAPTTLWTIAYSELLNIAWAVEGSAQSPTFYIEGEVRGRTTGKTLSVLTPVDPETGMGTFRATIEDRGAATQDAFRCALAELLVLQIGADRTRLAQNFGRAAGVTAFDDYRSPGRIEGENALWTITSASPQYANLRFNLSSGDLASSTSTTGTYSTLSLASHAESDTSVFYSSYGESLRRSDAFFDYKDARILCFMVQGSDSGAALEVSAYGNQFMPASLGDRIPAGSCFNFNVR